MLFTFISSISTRLQLRIANTMNSIQFCFFFLSACCFASIPHTPIIINNNNKIICHPERMSYVTRKLQCWVQYKKSEEEEQQRRRRRRKKQMSRSRDTNTHHTMTWYGYYISSFNSSMSCGFDVSAHDKWEKKNWNCFLIEPAETMECGEVAVKNTKAV